MHNHDHRHFQHRHLTQVERNRFGHAAFLGLNTGKGRRGVDETDDRPAELLRHLHGAQRLAITVGPGVTEVTVDLLLGITALLVPDHHDRRALVERGARDNGVVVGKAAIAVQLDEVREQALDIIERRRPARMPGHLHTLPRRQVLVEFAANGGHALLEPRDLSVAVVADGQRRQCLDFLQQDGDGFFELK